jgi:hypothetical protein
VDLDGAAEDGGFVVIGGCMVVVWTLLDAAGELDVPLEMVIA